MEAQPFSKLTGQGSGVECAARLPRTIAKPEWYQGLSWQVPEQGVLWRADETELVRHGERFNAPSSPRSSHSDEDVYVMWTRLELTFVTWWTPNWPCLV